MLAPVTYGDFCTMTKSFAAGEPFITALTQLVSPGNEKGFLSTERRQDDVLNATFTVFNEKHFVRGSVHLPAKIDQLSKTKVLLSVSETQKVRLHDLEMSDYAHNGLSWQYNTRTYHFDLGNGNVITIGWPNEFAQKRDQIESAIVYLLTV